MKVIIIPERLEICELVQGTPVQPSVHHRPRAGLPLVIVFGVMSQTGNLCDRRITTLDSPSLNLLTDWLGGGWRGCHS